MDKKMFYQLYRYRKIVLGKCHKNVNLKTFYKKFNKLEEIFENNIKF